MMQHQSNDWRAWVCHMWCHCCQKNKLVLVSNFSYGSHLIDTQTVTAMLDWTWRGGNVDTLSTIGDHRVLSSWRMLLAFMMALGAFVLHLLLSYLKHAPTWHLILTPYLTNHVPQRRCERTLLSSHARDDRSHWRQLLKILILGLE